ncbi:GNAT family N-acetyltransferase [Pseudomonas sp. MWU16-30322]|uniref:GNAT family N-acetyltransferase n=1 Tax=Pseudomonas sp. MWU16-30322 TaxID=2878092 RepID=UPI001CFA4801|nr:GNAT family N-acetyltransferase [Pseudomonas sp. MWU16-30322]
MTLKLLYVAQDEAKKIADQLLETDPEAFPRAMDGKSSRKQECVLIENNGNPIGFANVTSGDGACEIYRFFIAADDRNSGFGKAAANLLMEDLQARKIYQGCYLEIAEDKIEFWNKAINDLELLSDDTGMHYKEF